jgi:DNA-directed RNA polymerase subunit M/transcription elongation factor TFIIS
MHFCTECKNMYYLKLNENDMNSLIYYCRNCGNVNTELSAENVCVSSTHTKQAEQQFTHIVNEYTKYDPTLPRINTIDCPNEKCDSNSKDAKIKVEREVIYIRYDDTNMKYMYVCAICNTSWKNNK